MAPPRVELIGIEKRFGPQTVLRGVDLAVGPGEVHALVGQNGSGKSTLVKALAGYHGIDGGVVRVDGHDMRLPMRARDLVSSRLSFVHQDPGLLPELTVRENICVGRFERHRLTRAIAWRHQEDVVAQVMNQLDLVVDQRRPVDGLGATDRALIALARALMPQVQGPGLVVLDEATRAIPGEALPIAHRAIRRLTQAGGAVIMVSHNLGEVIAVADKATVLRDGEVVAAAIPTSGLDEATLAKYMLGRELDADVHRRGRAVKTTGARTMVTGLTGGEVANLSLEAAAGDLLGLTGRPGSGFDAVPQLLSGVRRPSSGKLQIGTDSFDLARCTIADLSKGGVALIPEARAEQGLALEQSMRDNLTLPYLRQNGRRAFVGSRWRDAAVVAAISRFHIVPPDAGLMAKSLSGGNQQKLLLAKWLMGEPRLLIAHEPTQGVDVGARLAILDALRDEAHRGACVIIASLESEDLAALCTRVIVLEAGAVSAILTSPTPEEIVETVYGVSHGAHGGPVDRQW